MFRILQHGKLLGKLLNSQFPLSDLPAGNDGSHQNKYQVQDDENNYLDSLQARLKGEIGDYPRGVGGSHIKRSGVLFGNFTEKDPLRSTKTLFSGRVSNIFSPRRATNSITNIICRYFLC